MVCASIFCRMVVPILYLRWERWLMLLKKESDYATLSFLFCRTYDKIFGTRHLYRIDSHVWRSFLPCGLSCFTNLPLHEFVNSRVSTNEMKAVFDDTFIEKLGEQKHVTDRIRVVEEYLLAYLARHYQPADSHVAMAVNMINHSKGKRSVRSLMDDVCLCQRHFERKFKHYTGFTPKEYSRIVKFKNAVELLRTTTSANLLTTAVDAGYYDLAHFSKEIKSMSGNTPASFLSLTVPEETTLTYIEPQR